MTTIASQILAASPHKMASQVLSVCAPNGKPAGDCVVAEYDWEIDETLLIFSDKSRLVVSGARGTVSEVE